MSDVGPIVGTVAGLLSLAGTIYLIGYWKGKVDQRLDRICGDMEKFPPQVTAIQVKTLWDFYVVDALRSRPDLAQHKSPFRLTPKSQDMIPAAIKHQLNGLFKLALNSEAIASGFLVVQTLGTEVIIQFARDQDLSVQEAIAVLSTYLDEHHPGKVA